MASSSIFARLSVGIVGGYVLTSIFVYSLSKAFVAGGYDKFAVINWLTMLSYAVYVCIIIAVVHARSVKTSIAYMSLVSVPLIVLLFVMQGAV